MDVARRWAYHEQGVDEALTYFQRALTWRNEQGTGREVLGPGRARRVGVEDCPVMILANARVVTVRRLLSPGWVALAGGRIVGVGAGDPPFVDGVVHDLDGRSVLPGFIDVHMHGGGGAQITTDDPAEILAAVEFHRAHGTTRTLASLVTDQLDRMAASVRTIAGIIRGHPGSSIVGIHLEGPFLNPAKRGSHDAQYLLAPDRAALRHLLQAGDGTGRTVTLAPELPGGMDLLRDVVDAGVRAAVGHTEASFDEARLAFASGARIATHLFNAMRDSTTGSRGRPVPRSLTTTSSAS